MGDDVEVDPGSKDEEVDEAANKQDGDKEEDAAAAAAAAMMLRLFEDMLGYAMIVIPINHKQDCKSPSFVCRDNVDGPPLYPPKTIGVTTKVEGENIPPNLPIPPLEISV